MKNTYTSKDLELLINGKGNICVSMILPLARLNPLREKNKLIIKQAIERLQLQAATVYPSQDLSLYLRKITDLFERIDLHHPPQGVGIWVSDKISLFKMFSFTPEETIQIGSRFAIRELLKLHEFNKPFLAMLFNEEVVNIFQGNGLELTPINELSVALDFKEQYEYSPPNRSSSIAGSAHVKSFERDEELTAQERRKNIFKTIDLSLQQYITSKTSLILIGEPKLTNAFSKVSMHPPTFLKCIDKDPSHLSPHDVALLCRDSIHSLTKKEHEKTVANLKESVGTGHARIGLQACWRAAQEGNCNILLAERDYHQPGFLTEDPYHLFLTPPASSHQILTDATDELMELVLEKKGSVVLMEPGMLEYENKIGLITRY
jgi:Bacterial archaeo-eukaryotic release factor family 3